MAKVTLHRVTKTWDDGTLTLKGIDLTVRDGEFLTLTGPVGCGKTTLLRLIAGLERPDEGDILFDGRSVLDMEPLRRGTAMVFQNYSLYPDRSVYRNIAFPLETLHMPEEQLERKVRDMAKRLGLEELLQRMPAALSGGEKQRVAIARALVREPSVFLLDEPFSGQDEVMRADACAQLRLLQEETGGTFLYVTHDWREAMEHSDRIAVMLEGKIIQTGSPLQIFHNPLTLSVAQFMRPDEIREEEGGAWLEGKTSADRRIRFAPDGTRTSPDISIPEGTKPRLKPVFTEPGKDSTIRSSQTQGGRGFFRTVFEELMTPLVLNLLFLVTCIPVITIPAGMTAMCGVCLKMRHAEQVRLWRDYMTFFRRDFLRALGGGAVLTGSTALFAYVSWLYSRFSVQRSYLLGLGIITMLLMLCVLMTSFYFFPMNALIDLPVLVLLRNSFVLAASEILRSLAALALFFVLLVLAGAGLWPYSLVYLLLLAFALLSLILVYLTVPVIERKVALDR